MNKNNWRNLLAKARRGNADAQWEVGRHYEEGISEGISIKPQPLRAFHWYTLSAQQGDVCAQMDLGRLLSTGDGIKVNFDKAIFWCKKAVRQQSSAAAHNLGTIYRDLGKPALAFRWYVRAVEMDDLDSLFEVALCYAFGFGTRQNFKAAYSSLKKIIEGDPDQSCERTKENAQFWMGVFHLLGIGEAKKSIPLARKLLETANKDSDHEQANELLNLIGKTKFMLT